MVTVPDERLARLERLKNQARIRAAYKREQAGLPPTKVDQSLSQENIDAYGKKRVDAAEKSQRFSEELEASRKEIEEEWLLQSERLRKQSRIPAAYKRQQAGLPPTKADQTIAQAEIDAYAQRRRVREGLSATSEEDRRLGQMERSRQLQRVAAAYKRQQAGRPPTKVDQSLDQEEMHAYAQRRADAAEQSRKWREHWRVQAEASKKRVARAKATVRSPLQPDAVKFRDRHIEAQQGMCAHCGIRFDRNVLERKAELDHKLPLEGDTSRHTLENTWLLCHLCHKAKTGMENSSRGLVGYRGTEHTPGRHPYWETVWSTQERLDSHLD